MSEKIAVDERPWLTAHGDQTQLVVQRSPECRDTDPIWFQVAQHIEQHNMVLTTRHTVADPAFMFGSFEAMTYKAQPR